MALLAAGCASESGSAGSGASSGVPKVGELVDVNGDGVPDGKAVDINGDGIADGVDTNGDGKPDVFFSPPGGGGARDAGSPPYVPVGNGSVTTGPDLSGDGSAVCQSVVVAATPLAPDMLLVVDRSASMVGLPNGGPNRWDPSKMALKQVTMELQSVVQFGLMVFPPAGGIPLSCDAGKLNVPIGPGTAGKIASVLDSSTPDFGQTPTGATLEEALKILNPQPPSPDMFVPPQYVVLVTDGQPGCSPEQADPAQLAAANKAVADLAARGVKTFVVGYDITASADVDVMNGFAKTGGTGQFIPVDNADSLTKALRDVAGRVVSCDYKLDMAPSDPSYVLVQIDGKQVNLANLDGWSLDKDGTTVHLSGAACKAIQDGSDHTVDIKVQCDVVKPI